MHDQLPHPTGTSRPRTLARRAVSHAWTLAIGGLLVVACGPTDPAAGGARAAESDAGAPTLEAAQRAERSAAPTGTEDQDLIELARAFEPLDPTLTSDHHDAWLARQREVQKRLRQGGPALGLRALEAFQSTSDVPGPVPIGYLEIAAYCAPASTAPVLEELIVTYHGGKLLRARTEAVRLYAETSPERALEFLAPLALDERPNNTRPSQEALMSGWCLAAKRLGLDAARVPAEVATNLFQPPEARYVAIRFLGESGTPLAKNALRTLLVEATSDGLIRRKAAQGMVACMTQDELCPVLEEVAAHESDEHFLNFLGDMLERNCGG